MVVALKSLNNSKNVTFEFMNEITLHYKISYLHKIAHGLRDIHETELIHRDLHIDYNVPENAKNKLYGILPYIAPEILCGQNYTKAADIYSFGIIINLPEPKNSDDYYEENDNIISMKFSESLQIDISQLKNNNSFELKNSDDSSHYEKNDNIKMESSEFLQIDTLLLKIDNNNFPEQDNSDVSYEKNDNIISMDSSESLQIDISQLNTNKDDQDSKSKGKEKI
ncbi:kinase-like domain-containing protein [Rhizophagus irregularis DAOM 181602=DAOM 197198]|nr:kinase-like domain-containing protein [Rhizophagus irregularis DAOM 181602=DAOM 197198]